MAQSAALPQQGLSQGGGRRRSRAAHQAALKHVAQEKQVRIVRLWGSKPALASFVCEIPQCAVCRTVSHRA